MDFRVAGMGLGPQPDQHHEHKPEHSCTTSTSLMTSSIVLVLPGISRSSWLLLLVQTGAPFRCYCGWGSSLQSTPHVQFSVASSGDW